jgi:hypothetical protein
LRALKGVERMLALETVTAWILSLIMTSAPPGRKIYYDEGQETIEEATARYESIAEDVIAVVYDPATIPLFKGSTGRARTVSVILSIMLHESSFMRHVDYGLGKYSRGDNGQSWCLMQLRIGNGRTMRWDTVRGRPAAIGDHSEGIFEGYTGEDLVSDRKICIREGLKVLAVSFGGTYGLPLEDRLRVYASGSRDKGGDASHNRMNLAVKWFNKYHKTIRDAEVMQELLERQTPKLEVPGDQVVTQSGKISLLTGPKIEGPES